MEYNPEIYGLEFTHSHFNHKIYKSLNYKIIMEIVKIPKEEYEKMREELKLLRELKEVDWDLVRQFKDSLEDVKAGRIRRVA